MTLMISKYFMLILVGQSYKDKMLFENHFIFVTALIRKAQVTNYILFFVFFALSICSNVSVSFLFNSFNLNVNKLYKPKPNFLRLNLILVVLLLYIFNNLCFSLIFIWFI